MSDRLGIWRALALIGTLALVPACALTPVYTGGGTGSAQTMLSAIEIAPIAEKTGFLVRDRLQQRMGVSAGASADVRYRLEVVMDDRIDGFGIRGDNSIIRERRTLRARWRLTEIATGRVVIDTTSVADAGIDVVSSEYAVLAAEATALERLSQEIADQIVERIALTAKSEKL